MDMQTYLDQEHVWISAEGARVRIADMSADHARLAARWLSTNSTAIISVVEAARNEEAIAGDADVEHVLALVAQSPRQWITDTPLYRALQKVARV